MEIVNLCKEKEIGFIAMKALSGGLITNSALAYAYMAQFDYVALTGCPVRKDTFPCIYRSAGILQSFSSSPAIPHSDIPRICVYGTV